MSCSSPRVALSVDVDVCGRPLDPGLVLGVLGGYLPPPFEVSASAKPLQLALTSLNEHTQNKSMCIYSCCIWVLHLHLSYSSTATTPPAALRAASASEAAWLRHKAHRTLRMPIFLIQIRQLLGLVLLRLSQPGTGHRWYAKAGPACCKCPALHFLTECQSYTARKARKPTSRFLSG